MSTETYKKLITEKCPPRDQTEQVYASILIQLSEQQDKIAAQLVEVRKALTILARRILPRAEEVSSDQAPAQAEAPAEESPLRDKTPFPAGVKASVNDATPAAEAPAVEAAPAAEEAIPTPDVVGMPVPKVTRVNRNGKGASAS